VYTVAIGQSNTTYPLQISGVSLTDQYGNNVGPFSGSDVQKTISATAVTGPITIYQAAAVTTPTTNSTPSYGFVATESGTIHYGGDCSSPTTAAASGLNTVVFNALTNGTHSNCTITVTDAAGNVSNQLVISPFTVNTSGSTTATTATTTTTATSSSVDAEIQSLESQLAALQNQTSSSSVATSSYQFNNFLGVGSQSADVTALQQRLTKDGFYSGSITGYFGTLTEAAVKEYQAANGITQAGYVGPGTRALLNAGK
jgi:mRNA-degrading endonuclease toxin of MazEF toxin-antitoxin module